jgi:aldose 1-epimerase
VDQDDHLIVELRAAGAWVRVAPALGGRLTAACLLGPDGQPVPILHPYPEAHSGLPPWAKGGLFPLMPCNGRIAQARLQNCGTTLALNPHPGEPHALHGVSQRRRWAVQGQSEHHMEMAYLHEPDADWPWRFVAFFAIGLRPRSLVLDMRLVNRDRAAMPAGIGCHPYVPSIAGDRLTFAA